VTILSPKTGKAAWDSESVLFFICTFVSSALCYLTQTGLFAARTASFIASLRMELYKYSMNDSESINITDQLPT